MLTLSDGQVESSSSRSRAARSAGNSATSTGSPKSNNDPALLAPIEDAWAASSRAFGRPSIPMDRFVRLMVIKARSGGWGYENM